MKTNLKKIAGLVFVLAMIATMFVVGSMAVSAAATPTDVINPSTVTNITATQISEGYDKQFIINLQSETLTVPTGYKVESFSIGGGKWRNVRKEFTGTGDNAVEFQKMINRGMTLIVSNKAIDRATKQPEADDIRATFPTINRRPRAVKLAVNYAIAYPTVTDINSAASAAGFWTIVSGTTPVIGTSTEITVASADNAKAPDGVQWQKLYDDDKDKFAKFGTPTNTFEEVEYADNKFALVYPVAPELNDSGKQTRTTFFVRTPATATGNAFTPASRFRRLQVRGVSRALNPSLKRGEIKLRKNVYWATVNGTEPATQTFDNVTLSRNGGQLRWNTLVQGTTATPPTITLPAGATQATIAIWAAPTAKKPASVVTTSNRAGDLVLASPTSTN